MRVVGGTVESTGTGLVTVTGRGGNAAGGNQYVASPEWGNLLWPADHARWVHRPDSFADVPDGGDSTFTLRKAPQAAGSSA